MMPQETTRLEQQAFIKGWQKFEIFTDQDLEVSFKRLATQRCFRIPLWQIDPKSERHKYPHYGTWISLAVFSALALVTLYGIIGCLRSEPDKFTAGMLAFPLVFFAVFSWICFWRLKTLSVDAVIFHTRAGTQIHVWHDNPDAATCNAFCETLSKTSEEAWNNRPLDPSIQSMAAEIAALKKLHATGVLSDAEFERAKTKIIDQGDLKRIGFV